MSKWHVASLEREYKRYLSDKEKCLKSHLASFLLDYLENLQKERGFIEVQQSKTQVEALMRTILSARASGASVQSKGSDATTTAPAPTTIGIGDNAVSSISAVESLHPTAPAPGLSTSTAARDTIKPRKRAFAHTQDDPESSEPPSNPDEALLHRDKIIPCPVCLRMCDGYAGLHKHWRKTHKSLVKPEYEFCCTYPNCYKYFRDRRSMNKHIKNIHRVQLTKVGAQNTCPLWPCLFKYVQHDVQAFHEHLEKAHKAHLVVKGVETNVGHNDERLQAEIVTAPQRVPGSVDPSANNLSIASETPDTAAQQSMQPLMTTAPEVSSRYRHRRGTPSAPAAFGGMRMKKSKIDRGPPDIIWVGDDSDDGNHGDEPDPVLPTVPSDQATAAPSGPELTFSLPTELPGPYELSAPETDSVAAHEHIPTFIGRFRDAGCDEVPTTMVGLSSPSWGESAWQADPQDEITPAQTWGGTIPTRGNPSRRTTGGLRPRPSNFRP